jgi:hypothetical protein
MLKAFKINQYLKMTNKKSNTRALVALLVVLILVAGAYILLKNRSTAQAYDERAESYQLKDLQLPIKDYSSEILDFQKGELIDTEDMYVSIMVRIINPANMSVISNKYDDQNNPLKITLRSLPGPTKDALLGKSAGSSVRLFIPNNRLSEFPVGSLDDELIKLTDGIVVDIRILGVYKRLELQGTN